MWTTASSRTSVWRSSSRWRRIPRWRAAPRYGERKIARFVPPSTARAREPFRSASFVIRTRRSAGLDGRLRSAANRLAMSRRTLSSPTIADASRFSAKAAAPAAFRPSLPWRLGLAALSVCLAFVWAPAATVAPAKELGEAGVAAFQAFARPGVEPVEFATSDRTEAATWLTARLTHPVTSARHSRHYQADGSADRSLSWRPSGLSDLQIARQACRIVDPVS